jgi:hypothetical protein
VKGLNVQVSGEKRAKSRMADSSVLASAGKAPNFRLDLRPPDSVGLSLELLPPLLERDDSGIGRERGKYVVRHVHRRARITHKAYVGEHAEDAVCEGPLEDGR